MRILLDECVDRRFKNSLPGHETSTVQEMGWAGTKNGELLKRAESIFQVFITVDRNLYFQQDLTDLGISVVILSAATNRIVELKKLGPQLLTILPKLRNGQVLQVSL